MEPFLQFEHIFKQYPGVAALNDVSLSFAQGEVHALMGANGAGKSTLIKMLSGAEQPTSGVIRFQGQAFHALHPHTAIALGIGVVYQENTLVPSLPVVENIFVGRWPGNKLTVDKRRMLREARELMNQFGIDVDPNILVEDLSPALQQIVEIIKTVSRENLKVLVLDEPTAPLTMAEVDILFQMVATLKQRGITVIYISHRMEEIFQISDRVSVLRDGCYIATCRTADIDRAGLISLMIGQEVSSDYPPPLNEVSGEVVLRARNITGNGVENISFDLHKGEILGFAGLVGCGRTELMSVIFGDVPMESGQLELHGQPVRFRDCRAAIRGGLGLIPEDRKNTGLLLDNSISVNMTLAHLPQLSRLSVIDRAKERKAVEFYGDKLQIKTPSYTQHADKLSGGNQQKVVVAKWLVTDSEILIFDEPTRGIDVAAKQEIYKLMRQLTAEGKSILMVSSDTDELLGMSDRLVVLSEGQLAGELSQEEFDTHTILDLASGER